MANWSNTVYGPIVGSYGRIWIKAERTDSATSSTLLVTVGFYSKYSVTDSNNDLYFDNRSSSGSATTLALSDKSIKHTYDSGSGWHDNNSTVLRTFTYTYSRGTSDSKRYLYAAFSGIDRVGGTMYANMEVTIPKLATYTISYDANGGSGAPGNQTKYHDIDLTLSSTVPTRAGYTFVEWLADGDAGFLPGGKYTINYSVVMVAVWKANTYTVSYNANGGSGAPGNQTKTHGVILTLSSTIPTRTNYTFEGWATSASGGVSYNAGSSYTDNAALTLYAVWELNYAPPRITNLAVNRCVSESNTAANADGTYALVKFNWVCDRTLSSITIEWIDSSGTAKSKTVSASGTSGYVSTVIGSGTIEVEKTYRIVVTVKDTVDESYGNANLYGKKFVMDFLAGGNGVAFGKAAERDGFAEFGYDTVFVGNVHGNAMGLNGLPQIGENEDLNSYLTAGAYGIQSHAVANTISNRPSGGRAARLIVCAATGGAIIPNGWNYIQQWYIPMYPEDGICVRIITSSPGTSPTYNAWRKIATSPA